MNTTPLDITGQKQLMLDPRVIAESDNAFTCMSEANKIGKIIELPASMKQECWPHYATVVWDERLGKVRLYYEIRTANREIYSAIAESSDGEHFVSPDMDLERLRAGKCDNILQIRNTIPDCDRMLDAHRATGPVEMNGKIDGPAWKNAPTTINFMKTGADELSDFDTKARVLYDDEAVYVGFEVSDGKPGRQWNDDGPSADITKVDNIEVFIDTRCTRREYYFLSAGCYGQKRQERHVEHPHPAGDAWQDQWDISVDRRDDGWSAIVKVPLAMLELEAGDHGSGWGFNVAYVVPSTNRDEYALYTNWSGCKPHHAPDDFGALLFDEPRFNAEFQPLWEDLHTGRSGHQHRENVAVFIDPNPDAPDAERYKLVCCDGGYMYAAASADGLTFDTQKIILNKGNLDSTNIPMWDSLRGKYAVYTRWWFRGGGFPAQRRGAARTESDQWATGYDDRKIVMDPRNFPGNEQGYNDFYMPGVFIYENLYLAMPTVYHRNIGFGPLDPCLMVSTDGYNWNWLGDGQPFIPRTPGQFDCTRIYAHVPPIAIGDRLYFYYTGHPDGHHEGGDGSRSESGLGAAWITRDRFLCYCGFTRWPATAVTQPMIFRQGAQLVVNVETVADNSELRIEVVGDERFSLDKCNPIKGDHLEAPVTWNGATLGDLEGKPVQLKFHLAGARVYAFEVK